MADATPEQAVAHPNWDMGAKISIDSATMMNKGLELIEAHLLFGLPPEQIEIVVHPQSVIHSMVAYRDGSVLAQLGTPDMRVPIAYTLGWPARIDGPAARLDFTNLAPLTFERPDSGRFPSLRLAREALTLGGLAPVVLNAANEVAVAAFLARRIGFLDIARIVENVMVASGELGAPVESLQQVQAADLEARRRADEAVQRTCPNSLKNNEIGGVLEHAQHRQPVYDLPAVLRARADAARVRSRVRSLLGRPPLRHPCRGLLDRLRPRAAGLDRSQRHALEDFGDPARRLREVPGRHRSRQRHARWPGGAVG